MTRHSNGQYAPRQFTAPLVRIASKSPAHVRAWQTRKAKRRAAVMAHCAALRASMGGVGGEWLAVFL